MQRQEYLEHLKSHLTRIARGNFENYGGGKVEAENYRVLSRRISYSHSIGELIRIAREMGLSLPAAIKVMLSSTVEDFDNREFEDTPLSWGIYD